MLTFACGRGGDLRGHAYVIIAWKKVLNNLHKLFQGKRKSLESFCLLYDMFNSASVFLIKTVLLVLPMLMHDIFLYTTFVILKFNNLLGLLK